MNESGTKSFDVLLADIGVTVCLVSKENVVDFVQQAQPLNPAFDYLSAVHQSDCKGLTCSIFMEKDGMISRLLS
jgi:hypothetical protein